MGVLVIVSMWWYFLYKPYYKNKFVPSTQHAQVLQETTATHVRMPELLNVLIPLAYSCSLEINACFLSELDNIEAVVIQCESADFQKLLTFFERVNEQTPAFFSKLSIEKKENNIACTIYFTARPYKKRERIISPALYMRDLFVSKAHACIAECWLPELGICLHVKKDAQGLVFEKE